MYLLTYLLSSSLTTDASLVKCSEDLILWSCQQKDRQTPGKT